VKMQKKVTSGMEKNNKGDKENRKRKKENSRQSLRPRKILGIKSLIITGQGLGHDSKHQKGELRSKAGTR